MKILYFPGLASLTDKTYDISKSCKMVHLQEMADCDVFSYKDFHPAKALKFSSGYDILFGSSFGGYFAFYISVMTGVQNINVNPSLYLDSRIDHLKSEYKNELAFLDAEEVKKLKTPSNNKKHQQISVLMNMNDEILDASRVVSIAENFGCKIFTFEKGGHESTNFQGDMLPTIKMLLNS